MSEADLRGAAYLRLVQQPPTPERDVALSALAGDQLAATRAIIVGPDESRVIDEACAALARAPEIDARSGNLVEVIVDEPQTRGLARNGPICMHPAVR